jgi:hypothetical protein
LAPRATPARQRERTDRALAVFIRWAPSLFGRRGMRLAVPTLAWLLVTLCWPTSALRRRSRLAGQALAPWAFGRGIGHSLCDLFGLERCLQITGRLPRPSPAPGSCDALDQPARGMLLLGAHLGPWEAGAAELARRGFRPMVLAAPWPRLPRSAAALADRRASLGVRTATRGRSGWRSATEHLRSGGTVVALVDSLSPLHRGRRSLPFVEGDVGAPDALLAWAHRQGAHTALALGHPGGFHIEASAGADHCVRRLREAVEQHPSSWAWVRALALAALMLPTLGLSSCVAADPLPPLPRDPAAWQATAEDIVWTGTLSSGLRGRFAAVSGAGLWADGAPVGKFSSVRIDLWSSDTGLKLAELEAVRGRGHWPIGPVSFEEVRWTLPAAGQQGQLDGISWASGSGWACDGCPLELLPR